MDSETTATATATTTPRKSGSRKRKVKESSENADGESINAGAVSNLPNGNPPDGNTSVEDHPTATAKSSKEVEDLVSTHPLLRDETKGMNPTPLLTGHARGRHTVHEGALCLPREALEIMSKVPIDSCKKWLPPSSNKSNSKQLAQEKKGTVDDAHRMDLPPLDSVKRPSMDVETHKSVLVTEIFLNRVLVPQADGTQVYEYKTDMRKTELPVKADIPPERIRGGGGGEAPEGQGRSNVPVINTLGNPSSTNTTGSARSTQQQHHGQNEMHVQQQQSQQQTQQQQQQQPPDSMHNMDERQQIQQHQYQLQQIHQQHVQMRQQQLQQHQEELRRQHEQSVQQMKNDPQMLFQQQQEEQQRKMLQQQQQQQQEQQRKIMQEQQRKIMQQQQEEQQRKLMQQQQEEQQRRMLQQQKEEQQRKLIQQQEEQLRKQQQEHKARQEQLRQQQQQLQLQQEHQRIMSQQQHLKPPPTSVAADFSVPAPVGASMSGTSSVVARDSSSVSAPSGVASGEVSSSGQVHMLQQHVGMVQPSVKSGDEKQMISSVHAASVASSSSSHTPSSAVPGASSKSTTQVKKQPPIVVGLKQQPEAQWEQHVPGPNDEMGVDPATKAPKPDWYKADSVCHLEQTLLPEWFDESAAHRTPNNYRKARETMIKISAKLGTRYLTATMARRSIPGDAGSLIRLHEFLCSHGLINEDSINDSAPTPHALQTKKSNIQWPQARKRALLQAVLEQSRKRQKEGEEGVGFVPIIDWDSVADQVGGGAIPTECENEFLRLKIPETPREGSITPETTSGETETKDSERIKTESDTSESKLTDLLDTCEPKLVHAVTEAALANTTNLGEAQIAALGGLALSQNIKEALSQEGVVARLLSEVVDLRMKKLENRMTLMDDMEGLLEAERVALELERRDLYTTRCRHWFGGS